MKCGFLVVGIINRSVNLKERAEGASSILCKRPFFLAPQAVGAMGKRESWFWISTFPWPTVILRFGLPRLHLGTTGFRLGPSEAPAKPGNAIGTPGVYRIDKDGREARLLGPSETEWPNGLVISPDDRTLYLVEANKVEGGTRAIRAFDLSPAGTLSNRRVLYNFYPGRSADGLAIDVEGNLYAAAGLHRRRGTHETLDTKCGVHVISPQGKLLRLIPIPEDTITNTAFGGPDLKTLYITAGKTLFQIPNSIAGLSHHGSTLGL